MSALREQGPLFYRLVLLFLDLDMPPAGSFKTTWGMRKVLSSFPSAHVGKHFRMSITNVALFLPSSSRTLYPCLQPLTKTLSFHVLSHPRVLLLHCSSPPGTLSLLPSPPMRMLLLCCCWKGYFNRLPSLLKTLSLCLCCGHCRSSTAEDIVALSPASVEDIIALSCFRRGH